VAAKRIERAETDEVTSYDAGIGDRRRCPARLEERTALQSKPVQAPNANAYAERFVHSVRAAYLDRLILFGERRLFSVLDEFAAHDHRERNYQGLGDELIAPQAGHLRGLHVRCRERLGRLLGVSSPRTPSTRPA
jgi:hypothetical protein